MFDIRTDIRPTLAEVDLSALRKNADVVAAAVGPSVGVLAVVKADAYGHGALACAHALERKVWGFAVSLVEEGVELRRGGIQAPILLLGNFYGLSHRDVVAYQLTPVVSDEADLERFQRAGEELGNGKRFRSTSRSTRACRASGCGRSSCRASSKCSRARPASSCPACARTWLTPTATIPSPRARSSRCFSGRRRKCLLAAGFRPTLTHMANSAGAVRFSDARFDLVRPGLALYGYGGYGQAGLSPVMSLKSRVVALRDVPAGTRISYGGLHTTGAPARIATVPVGYADGYSRRLSGQAEVLVGGRRCRVVGAITMDMCMVDVTAVNPKLGDEVVLFGSQGPSGARIGADELAKWGDTIVWEVFCGVSKRVPRDPARRRRLPMATQRRTPKGRTGRPVDVGKDRRPGVPTSCGTRRPGWCSRWAITCCCSRAPPSGCSSRRSAWACSSRRPSSSACSR